MIIVADMYVIFKSTLTDNKYYIFMLFFTVPKKNAKLKDLHNLVSPQYAVAWKEIGKELGVPLGKLNALQKDHPDDCDHCCDKMLEEWCNLDVNTKWSTVLKALDSPAVVGVLSSFSDPISTVSQRLQDDFTINRHSASREDWPLFQPKHFTSVALIHHKRGHSRKKDIEFIAGYQHRGQISLLEPLVDVNVSHTSKGFFEIFDKIESTNRFPNTVLIEGAPGIGKTTLCKEIVYQWSTQKLLNDKKLMILVFLRDPKVQSICSLKDFIKAYCNHTEKCNDKIEEYIKSNAGKDVAIVLDGYDELPENIRADSESFFVELVHRKCKELLHSTIAVTSRLNVSVELRDIVDRRVEILGFTENNRKEYIRQALENNGESVEKLTRYLDINPAINAYCYIPLNMTILLCLFKEGGEDAAKLPATQTEINKKFICITISRFIKKRGKANEDWGIPDFNHIPIDYKLTFNELCRLAFDALQNDKIVFTKNEIKDSCKYLARSENWNGLGLLKAVEFCSLTENVKNTSFNFLHLSLQETLAAYHITMLQTKRQSSLLQRYVLDSRYFNTWILYVGLTKGHSFAFRHFLSGNSLKISTFVSSILKKNATISKKLIDNRVICLHLFQCFSEAENDDMCQYIGQLLRDGEIDLSGQALNPVNVHTLGLFLDRSFKKNWKLLNLSNCFLGTQEFEHLFIFCNNNTNIDCLNLSYNNLMQSSASILANFFVIWKVKIILMYSDDIDKELYDDVIQSSLMQFSKLDLVPSYAEILTTGQHILACCKNSYEEIIELLYTNTYSSIHYFSCHMGSTYNESAQMSLLLSDKDVYLYNCKICLIPVLETVMNSEISSFHIIEDKDMLPWEIKCVVEKLAEFAVTFGEVFLPLHLYNMSKKSFRELKALIQENTHGTFVFSHCTGQNVHEILSGLNSQRNLTHFIFKWCVGYQRVTPMLQENSPSSIFDHTNGMGHEIAKGLVEIFQNSTLLQQIIVFHCKLQSLDFELSCKALTFTKLNHINLSGNSISISAAEILANGIAESTSLKHLELANCNLLEEGLRSICVAIKGKHLQTLNLSNNCITDQIADDLAYIISSKSCMKNLYMSKCSLCYNGIKALISALAKIRSLKTLDLSHNTMTSTGLEVAAVFTNNNLEHLNFSYSSLKQVDLTEIFTANCGNLKVFNFSGNQIGASVHIITFLSNSSCLQILSLSKCSLEETQIISVFGNMRNSLKHLDLSFNVITDKAAKSVADVIHNNPDLEHLNLSNCSLQKGGLAVILRAVRTACRLKYLNLQSNKITDVLASEIAAFISALEYLSLSDCAIQKEGFLRICDGLKKTSSLIHLNLSFNFISSDVGSKLAMTNVFIGNPLKYFDASECQWERNSFSKMLLATMNVQNLKYVNYSGCKMDDGQAVFLASSITINNTLEQLILANCGLPPTGFVGILGALKELHTLRHLNLSHNHITNEVIVALAEVTSGSQLEHLNVSHCLQGTKCSDLVLSIANNITFQYLDLSYNDISDDEASFVASAITANEYLYHVNLTNNKFNTTSIKSVLNAMATKHFIHHINLSSYCITNELACDLEAVAGSNSGLEKIALDEYVIHDIKEHLPKSITKLIVNKLCINSHTVDDSEACAIESLIDNNDAIFHFELDNSVIPASKKLSILKAMMEFSQLRHLNLNYITVIEEMEDELVSLIHRNTNLQHLELAGCELSKTFPAAFSQSLSKLLHLNLSYNTFTFTDFSNLLSQTTALQCLKMDGCGLSKTASLNVIRTLTFLDLSNNPISDLHAGDVADLIANNISLQNINISNCGFDSSGILKITKVLKQFTNVRVLDFGSNHMSGHLEYVAEEMVGVITSNKGLEHIHLPHCQFHDKDMKKLFEVMKNVPSLKCVDINYNEISSTLSNHVRPLLENGVAIKVIKLSLSQNQLDQLCDDSLPQFRAQHISLYQCCISDEQLRQLCGMFSNNQNISHFSMTHCLFSDRHNGACKLFNSLKHSKYLKSFELKSIALTIDSVDHVAAMITANKLIVHFCLTDCNMPKIQTFFGVFKDNNSMQSFVISDMIVSDMMCIADAFKCSTSLKYLNLHNCRLQDKDVLLVCEVVKTFTDLLHLNVSGNNITDQSAEILAMGITNNTGLQHLELAGCNLHEEGLRLISIAIKDRNLQTLNLNCNCITDQNASNIAHYIKSKSCIKTLYMSRCSLQCNGIKALISALATTKSLKALDLSHNKITNVNLDLAAVIFVNSHLEHLDLSYCELKQINEVFKANCVNLQSFNFSGNQISDSAAIFMTQLLSNTTCLQSLSVSKCYLQESGLIDTLGNVKHSLKHLDISYNVISDEAAKSVADVIHNNSNLEYLNLSNCELQDEGLTVILSVVKTTSRLKHINLKSNRMNDMLASQIAECISNNHGLSLISLSNCALQEEGFLRIADAFTKTNPLFHFDISSNLVTDNVATNLANCNLFSRMSQITHLDVSQCQWEMNGLSTMFITANKVYSLKCINCSGCEVNEKEAQHLASTITINNTLEQLILANCTVKPTGFVKIFNAVKKLYTLKHLDLCSSQISGEVIFMLAECISGNQVEHLDLSHCLQGVNSLNVLTAIASGGTLQYLDLSYNDISDDEASCVASAISANKYLYHINLTNNQFNSESVQLVFNAMAVISSLQFVDLRSYTVSNKLAVDLETVAISNTGLESIVLHKYAICGVNQSLSTSISKLIVNELCINEHHFSDSEAYAIASLINNSISICYFDLANSNIPDATKPIIIEAMKKNHMLKHLNLNSFTISKMVQTELSSLIAQNTKLQHLEMAGCQLTEPFLVSLAQALCTHNELSYLNLSNNTITPTAVAEICNILPIITALNSLEMAGCGLNKTMLLRIIETLTLLDLSNNPISDLHADDVADLIANNANLQHLNLSNCEIKSRGVLTITKALTETTKLLYLNLRLNHPSENLESVATSVAALITSNKGIKYLLLPHCVFHDKVMKIILEAMTAISSLILVDITCNRISAMLSCDIRAVLASNVSLEGFTMDELIVSQSELDQLSDILPKFKTQHICLHQCCISDEQLRQLCVMFSSNSNISNLNVDDCQFSDKSDGFSKLFKSLNHTRFLKQVKLNRIILVNESCNHVIALVAANRGIENFYMANCTMPEQGMTNFFNVFRNLQHFSINDMIVSRNVCVSKVLKASISLKHVNLMNSKLQSKDVLMVCEALKAITTLVHINLSGNNISNQSAEILSLGITRNEGLQHLALASCSLYDEGLSSICNAIKYRNLLTLNLSYNAINDYVAVDVACAIMTKSCIEVLQIRRCSLGSNGIQTLLSALGKINTLKDIDLSNNQMSNETLDITDTIVANTHLENLDLSHCGLSEIKISTKPSSLKVLNVNGNCMSNSALFIKNFISKSACFHSLSLSNCTLNETVLMKLLIKVKNSLKHLDLSFNEISDKAAKSVADVIHRNTDLEHLNLSNCKLQEEGLSLILKAVKKAGALKYLNLESNLLNNILADEMAVLIRDNNVLNHLFLSDCIMQKKGFLTIGDSLLNTNLIQLDISSNVITNNIAAKLTKSKFFLAKSQLKYLDILQCDCQENSLTIILNATINMNQLRYINVSGCKMDDIEIQRLATSITANNTLEQLILAKCGIQSDGLISVLDAVKKLCTLKHLNLSCNLITDLVFPTLVEAISHNQIQHLDLSHCLQAVNSSNLLTAIANSGTLQYLDLSYNDISDDEASCAASAITANGYLYHVNLTNNHFDSQSVKTILKAMARISSLRHVNISSYALTEELTVDVKAVAISNPGLETILVLQSEFKDAKLEKVLNCMHYI